MQPTDLVDHENLRDDVPNFGAGDTLKVHVRVVEGNRQRVQMFEGVVIKRQGSGVRETFTVRKLSFGVSGMLAAIAVSVWHAASHHSGRRPAVALRTNYTGRILVSRLSLCFARGTERDPE